MNLEQNWPTILRILANGKRSNKHFAIATIDARGGPHVTPIGHAFFRDDMTGYYFDAYSRAMPKHFETDRRICLMAVNVSSVFWLRALFQGKFASAPGVRLFGEVGEVRDALQDEVQRMHDSIRKTRGLRGHKQLWNGLTKVRDMRFFSFAPVAYPVMCEGLWR